MAIPIGFDICDRGLGASVARCAWNPVWAARVGVGIGSRGLGSVYAIRTVVAGRAGGASLSCAAGEVLANRTPHNQAGQ